MWPHHAVLSLGWEERRHAKVNLANGADARHTRTTRISISLHNRCNLCGVIGHIVVTGRGCHQKVMWVMSENRDGKRERVDDEEENNVSWMHACQAKISGFRAYTKKMWWPLIYTLMILHQSINVSDLWLICIITNFKPLTLNIKTFFLIS